MEVKLFILLTALCMILATNSMALGEAAVISVAGNGYAGVVDGPNGSSLLMAPDGLAFDKGNGALFITDSSGQRIRELLADGRLITIAGGGVVAHTGLDVVGSYRDGSGADARFNHPTGIAITPDGSLYIADSLNQCIRLISQGFVSTVVGRPNIDLANDGTLTDATFLEPLSIALRPDGQMFVADYGVGIRLVTETAVSTLQNVPQKFVSSVSLSPNDPRYLFFSAEAVVTRLDLKTGERVDYPMGIEAASLLAVDDDSVVMTSIDEYRVFRVSFKCAEPRSGCSSLIAGKSVFDATRIGGFADGPASQSIFYNPIGIAQGLNGSIFVADSSNRRIREISNL